MKNGKNKNDILVVLCPGKPTDGCQFLEIEHNEIYDSKIYLGGEVRMKSAVKLSKIYDWIILVGGSEEKVSCMKKYILERVKSREKKRLKGCIIRIESDPDTNGNLNAVRKALDGLSKYESRLYFLTNKYHMKRVKLFAKKIFVSGKNFENNKFVIAENVASKDKIIKENIIDLIEVLGLRERIEQQGCSDWENRIYRNQHKELEKFKCVVHDISPYKKLIK